MNASVRAFITALMLFPIAGCAPGWREGGELSARTVESGLQCGRNEPTASARWIDNPDAFEAAYRQLDHVSVTSLGTIPEVDFETDGIVLIQMGERQTTGYGINLITDEAPVLISDDTAHVTVRWSEPQPDSVTAQMITSPCLFIALARGDYRHIEVRDDTGRVRAVADVGGAPR